MSIALNSHLRRHRRGLLTAFVAFAIALTLVGSHSAAMADVDHASGSAVICLALGASLAIAGTAVFVVQCRAERPAWLIPAPLPPSLPFIPPSTGSPARAGPPPLLQVFRL